MTDNNNNVAAVYKGAGTVMSADEALVICGSRAVTALEQGMIDPSSHDRSVTQILSDLDSAEKSRERTFGMLTDLRQAVQHIVDEIRDVVAGGDSWNMHDWDDFENAFSALDKFGIDVERPRTEFTATVTVTATFEVSGYTLGDIDDVREALAANGDWSHACDFLNFDGLDYVTVEQDRTYVEFEPDYIEVEES